jgi:hypothetical protein
MWPRCGDHELIELLEKYTKYILGGGFVDDHSVSVLYQES